MNLTGKWKGIYVYGPGYSIEWIGKSEEFILNINDNEGIITGTCDDPIVQKIKSNISTIEGAFKDGFLSFIKKYRYFDYIEDPDFEIKEGDISSSGIHYTGTYFRPFFSKKDAFKGEWISNATLIDSEGKKFESIGKGTWKMKRI